MRIVAHAAVQERESVPSASPPAMTPSGTALSVAVGYASHTGKRRDNEDFCGFVTPGEAELETKGILLAVADGVSASGVGREAAEYAVRSVLSDYYATPDTWEVARSLDRVVDAANRWLVAQGTARRQSAGMATTLSALVLRGSRYHVAHVGDTRVYRLAKDDFVQLTTDHVWDRPDMRHVLRRAVGLDPHLSVDYTDGPLHARDMFLLCSDGVWEPLGAQRMRQLLTEHADPQQAAKALVESALAAGGADNATAMVARVERVSVRSWRDMLDAGRHLRVPPRLKPGQRIDDFEVMELLHESRATLLYRVRSTKTGEMLALKTLQPVLEGDSTSYQGLLAEEWLSKRIVSDLFPQVVPVTGDARAHLYYTMSYHAGATLQAQLDRGRHFAVGEVIRLGAQVAKGLGVLHRLSILHRDVKPANLLQEEGGRLRILDLGVALAAGVPYPELHGNAGTPSYMAPELFAGTAASAQTDIYAAGVTLFHLLTRRYPYGEVEPFQTPRFGEPTPPTRYRPDIPRWLENLLLRAVARDPRQRFETAEELLVALERGDAQPVAPPQAIPLVHDRVTRWQAIAALLLALDLLLLYAFLIR